MKLDQEAQKRTEEHTKKWLEIEEEREERCIKREEEHEHRMMSMFTGFMMQMTQVMCPTINSYGFPPGNFPYPDPNRFCSSSSNSSSCSYSMCNSDQHYGTTIPNQGPTHSHEQNEQ